MKILIDCIIFEYQKFGGISEYFRQYILFLSSKKEIQLSLIIYSDLDFGNNIVYIKRNRRFLEKYRFLAVNGNYDLVIPSYYRFWQSGDSKKLLVVHDFIYEQFRGLLPRSIHGFLKRSSLKHADFIVCISNSTRDDLFRFYPNITLDRKNNVFTVYNGVSEIFTRDWSNLALKLTGPLVFIGTRIEYKNFRDAVRIANFFQDHEFVIVGGGSLSKTEIASIVNPHRVQYFENIETIKLNEILNRASFLLYTSLYEGFGIPILEAYRTGTLVLAYKTSGVSEVLLPEHCRVGVNNVLELIDLANEYLLNSDSYMRDSKKVEEWSRNFSWSKCFERQFEHINNLK